MTVKRLNRSKDINYSAWLVRIHTRFYEVFKMGEAIENEVLRLKNRSSEALYPDDPDDLPIILLLMESSWKWLTRTENQWQKQNQWEEEQHRIYSGLYRQ